MAALTGGELTGRLIDGWACFELRQPGRDGPVALVWPDGWTAQEDPLRLVDPDGEVYAEVGDVVELGGGYVPEPPVDLGPCGSPDREIWIASPA